MLDCLGDARVAVTKAARPFALPLKAPHSFARQVAMYLAHVVCGLSLTEVGALFARDRTTVAHAWGVVEGKRDDPELDGRLDHLERAVSSLIDAPTWHRGAP